MPDPTTGVFALESAYLDRWLQVGVASGNVIRLTWHADRPEGEETAPVLDRIRAYLDEGEAIDLADEEIALTVPTDHRAVYETVREIPYGRQLAVADIVGRTAGLETDDGGAETVTAALSANPIPLLIPEHRVRDAAGSSPAEVRRKLRALEDLA